MQGRYTVIELAELVGVPRTTINDWLGRYSQFIDFETQGRRRVYNDASVAVLKEISALRNSGLSSFEIEAELAKKHPLRGEPQPPEPVEAQPRPEAAPVREFGQRPPEQNVPPSSAPQDAPRPAANGEEFALMAKRQTDELAKVIGESFQNMARRIEDIERQSVRNGERATRWYLLSFALLLILVASGVLSYMKLEKVSSMRDELARADREKSLSIEALQKQLKDNTVSLSGRSDELRRNVQALEKGLVEQRADFEKALSQAKSESDAARQSEIERMRDKFAAERLELLRKLDAAPDSQTREAIVKEWRAKLEGDGAEKSGVQVLKAEGPIQSSSTAPLKPTTPSN